MLRWFLEVVGSLALLGLVLWLVLVVSIRTGFTPVLNGLRRMNRRFNNPRVMKRAGQRGASASVIHHLGRVSGKEYATPIAVGETDEGFAIALPYGTSPDWLKNVITAGSATLVHQGDTYQVGQPQVVSNVEGERYFSERARRTNRVYGIDKILVLRKLSPTAERGQR